MSSNLYEKKATKISLLNFSSAAMRAFHMSWLAFLSASLPGSPAPLMPVIAGEFSLTKDQIANINIAAVAITILVRLIVGPLCDKYGPRKTYTALLVLGSIRSLVWPLRITMNPFCFPLTDWRHWCQFRHYPISHQHHVCAECRGYCKCCISRLGKCRWRCDSSLDAITSGCAGAVRC